MSPKGRPFLPPEKVKSMPILVRLTPAQHAKIAVKAKQKGVSIAEYFRRAVKL